MVWLRGSRAQLALVGALVFATGWTVGVSKFSQVLMTSAGGKFETASERRAESFLITFGLAKAFGNLLVGAAADTFAPAPLYPRCTGGETRPKPRP